MLHRVWDELRQYECARNPGFCAEISRLAHLGLQVIGGVALAFAVVTILVTTVVSRECLPTGAYWAMGGVMAAGLAIIAISKTGWARPRASAIGLGGTFVIASFQIWFSLLRSAVIPGADRYIVTQASVFLLVALVSLPLHPMQILGLGVSITGAYALSAYYAVKWALVADSGALPLGLLFVFLLSLLSTALAAVVHRRLYATYIAHQRELRASEDLRLAQMRAFLSENAAAMGRLAAALSHELNSPVGVIKSSVDTLEVLAQKKDQAGESERQRLEKMQHALLGAARASAERLHEIVGRMLRFTNLDRAELQSLDLNSLVRDVAYLVESDLKGVARVELDLRTLPPVTCRPQQLSAVFSNLLYHAVEASGSGGAVRIATHRRDGQVEVRIDDSGPGLDANALRSIFEPGFRVRGNRVATGNWSLFSARQVIREQGGEISVESRPGQGTTVTVVLPGEEQLT